MSERKSERKCGVGMHFTRGSEKERRCSLHTHVHTYNEEGDGMRLYARRTGEYDEEDGVGAKRGSEQVGGGGIAAAASPVDSLP